MERKDRIDAFGAASLTAFSIFLALNQIVIKLVNQGLQPVFFAGLRSLLALVCLTVWLAWRGRPPRLARADLVPGLVMGLAFSGEFICLFLALDLTTVTRTVILLYSMPVWMALSAHFLLPGERLTLVRSVGLAVAFSGVIWALLQHATGTYGGTASLRGDLCALAAAMCWAAVVLIAKGTRMRQVRPEMQLYWQVLVSVPVLFVAAPFFGPLIRDFQPVHLIGLVYQAVLVVSAGFMFWLWLLSVYPAAGVASFSFLTPVFGVGLGWMAMGEHVGLPLIGSLLLVAAGILLINRPVRRT